MQKKMPLKFKFLIAFLVILLIAAGAYLYISLVFVPYKLKDLLAVKAEEFLHRKVSLASIDVKLLKGITIHQLEIKDKKNPDQPFIAAKEISFNLLFAPIFKNKVILIPSLKIVAPEIYVSRQTQSEWNYSDLIPAAQPSAKTPSKSDFQFALQKVIINDGKVTLTDLSQADPFKETLNIHHMEASVSIAQKAQFDVNAELSNHQSPLIIKGSYDIPSKKAQLDVNTENLYFNDYLPRFADVQNIPLKSGVLSQAELKINYSEEKTDVSGKLNLAQAKINPAPEQMIEGNFNLKQFSATYSGGNISLQGDINLEKLNVNAPPVSISQADIDTHIESLTVVGENITLKGNVESKNLNLKHAPDLNFTGDLKASNINLTKNDNNISLKGDVTLSNAEIVQGTNQQIKGDITLSHADIAVTPDTLKLNTDLALNNADIKAKQNDQTIQLTGDITADDLKVIKDKDDLNLKTKFDASKISIDLGNGMTFQDSLSGSAVLSGNLLEPAKMIYQGEVKFSDASASGLPTVGTIEHLKGKINLDTDQATLTSVSFQTLNIPVSLNGNIQNFAKPSGNISIQIPKIDLAAITPLLNQFAKDFPATLTGSADLKADIKGPLTDILSADINAVSQFSNINIESSKLPFPIKNMSGELNAGQNKADLKNVKLTILDKECLINGHVENFKTPSIKGTIASQDISLNIETTMADQLMKIVELTGKYFSTTFNVKGNVNLTKDKEPVLDVSGSAQVALSDLKYFPQLAEQVKQFNPTGTLTVNGNFKGSVKDMRSWNTDLKITSPRVTVMNFPIQEIDVQYSQNDLNPKGALKTSALLYGGQFTADGTINTSRVDLPIQMTAKLNRLDLSLFREDQKVKENNLSGFVSSMVDLTGPLKDINAYQGEGSIVVVDGFLGQLNFFNGLLGALLVIPEFKNIFITDVSVNFMISDGRISSDSILLASPNMQFKGKGWVDFKSNINVEVSPELSQIEMVKSESAKKIPTQLLANAVSVKCTGTANKPQCGLTNTPGKIIGETTDILKDGLKTVGGILQEIF